MDNDFFLSAEDTDWEESQSTLFLEEVLNDLLTQDDLAVVPTGGSLRWKEEE